MASEILRVLSAVPGSTTFGPIVRTFCRECRAHGSDGLITAFSDSALPMCAQFADENASEVLSFGEVVRRFLVLCGEDARPLAQSGHVEAAIACACRELSPDSPFLNTAEFGGLHKALASALKELHEWGIDRSELLNLAEGSSDRLAAKLRSLADIDAFVEDVLVRLGAQTLRTQMRACLDSTPELDGSFPRLLVHVGSEDSPLKLEWVRWVAGHAGEVVAIVERHATEGPVFFGAARASARMGVASEPTGDGNGLTRNLFARQISGGPPIEAKIVSAVDPLAECEWALRACLEAGAPSESGIYVRNLELYAPLLEAAGRRLGVPVTITRRVPLLTNSFARLTLAAMEFCASDDVRTLGPMLQSSYLGLTGEQQQMIRAALREAHGGRASQWDDLRAWTQAHLEAAPWLKELLDWRGRACSPLMLREWKNLLAELIRPTERFPWSIRIMDEPAATELAMSERDRYARNQLERLLANHVTVEDMFDHRTYSLSEMVARCRRLWQDAEVSVPAAEGGVCVADDPYRLTDVPVLHVMGMLEGVFPRRRTEEPILTDAERLEISAARPDAPPLLTSHDRAEGERDAFYRVCAIARRRVVFSYPLADDSRDNIPAFYLSEVERAMPGAVEKHNFPRNSFAPLVDDCVSDGDRRLIDALASAREYPSPVTLTTEAARAAIRPPEGAAFSPRDLRTALQCPFQYVVRNRLKLRPRRSTERWNSLARLPRAASLPIQLDRDFALRALEEALDAELEKLYSEVPDWEMQLLRSGGRRLIREWLRREFSSRELWPKEGLRMNVGFGSEGLNADMPGGVRLEGHLAAVSKHKGYSVAHLYESGVRDAKNLTDVERLYYGLHFLALHERGREGAIEIESMRGRRELMVLTRSGGEVSGQVQDALSVVDLSTSDDPVQSKREFFGRVKELLRTAAEVIREGRVEPVKGDHCDFCDYGELCRRARAYGEDESPFGDDEAGEDV